MEKQEFSTMGQEVNGSLKCGEETGITQQNSVVDHVFGEISDAGPNYRNVGWMGTTVLMLKTQIGLGVLSIPATFDTLGMIPGVICLLIIGIITTWSDYIVGVFKLNHPSVYGIDDVGEKLAGKPGRIFFGFAFVLLWVFVAAAGMLGTSISFNAMSIHGACTAVFVVAAAIIGCLLGSIQTLGRISWLAWVGVVAILSSILVLTIAVAVQDRPAAAPQEGPFTSNFKLVGSPTFVEAITALSSMVFAYAGTPAFFSIVSEMRNPKDYTRSLVACQSIVTATYVTIGIVVYYYCGSFVASPALGSAGPLLKRICYGLAFPGLVVSTTLFIHLAAKYCFVRILKGSTHLSSNTLTHWITWAACTITTAAVAYVIASAIPIFGGLISLIGALLATLMSFQPMGFMWLYDNWHINKSDKTWRWKFMVGWSIFVIISGTFLMIGGTYGSIVGIIDSYRAEGGSAAFSCADNSNSVGHN